MDSVAKISKAKAQLLLHYPYFGSLSTKLILVQENSIEAFESNGLTLSYNEKFIENASIDELEFMLANGAMHATLLHQNRKLHRLNSIWQKATDIAINDMLIQNNLTLPLHIEHKIEFSGMYAEEIYTHLSENLSLEDIQTEKSSSKKLPNPSLKEQLLDAHNTLLLEEESHLPSSLERFFNIKKQTKIPWKELLYKVIQKYVKDDFTLLRPNKKFLYQGIYLPSTTSQKFHFIIAIDSSASIDQNLLEFFLSEINSIMHLLSNYEIELLICDEKIHSHTTLTQHSKLLDLKIKGGGATDFRPVFEYIDRYFDDIALMLYFSDLEGFFPQYTPKYDVVWISPKEKCTPFGNVIVIN